MGAEDVSRGCSPERGDSQSDHDIAGSVGASTQEHCAHASEQSLNNHTAPRLRLCDFWSRNGNCLHGDTCKFLHDPKVAPRPLQSKIPEADGISPAKEGRNPSKGAEKQRKTSRSMPQSPEGSTGAGQPGVAPRRICDFFSKYGNCRSGNKCKFLHVSPGFTSQAAYPGLDFQTMSLSQSGSTTSSRSGDSPLNALSGAPSHCSAEKGATQGDGGWSNDSEFVIRDWWDPSKGRDCEVLDGRAGSWLPQGTHPGVSPQGMTSSMCVQRPNTGSSKGMMQASGAGAGGVSMQGSSKGRTIWAVSQDGTAWYLTGDGWAHNAAGGRRRVCDFYDVKGNCRHGSACSFLHIGRGDVQGDKTVSRAYCNLGSDSVAYIKAPDGMMESNGMGMGKGIGIALHRAVQPQGMQLTVQGMMDMGIGNGYEGMMGTIKQRNGSPPETKLRHGLQAPTPKKGFSEHHLALQAALEARAVRCGSPSLMQSLGPRSDSPLAIMPMSPVPRSPTPKYMQQANFFVPGPSSLSSSYGSGSLGSPKGMMSAGGSPRPFNEVSRSGSPAVRHLGGSMFHHGGPMADGCGRIGSPGPVFKITASGEFHHAHAGQAAALWGEREGDVGRLALLQGSAQMFPFEF